VSAALIGFALLPLIALNTPTIRRGLSNFVSVFRNHGKFVVPKEQGGPGRIRQSGAFEEKWEEEEDGAEEDMDMGIAGSMGIMRKMQHQAIEAGDTYTETIYLAPGWRCMWDFYTKDATVHFSVRFRTGSRHFAGSYGQIQAQKRVASGEGVISGSYESLDKGGYLQLTWLNKNFALTKDLVFSTWSMPQSMQMDVCGNEHIYYGDGHASSRNSSRQNSPAKRGQSRSSTSPHGSTGGSPLHKSIAAGDSGSPWVGASPVR
jgi:hypothetical protein